jgi:hypothetical protein
MDVSARSTGLCRSSRGQYTQCCFVVIIVIIVVIVAAIAVISGSRREGGSFGEARRRLAQGDRLAVDGAVYRIE